MHGHVNFSMGTVAQDPAAKKATVKKKQISRNAAEQAIRRMCTPRKRTNRRKVSEQIARQFFEGGPGRNELIKAFIDCDGNHEPQLRVP